MELLGDLRCGVVITDRAGNVGWTNEAFNTLVGYSREEIIERAPGLRPFGEHTGRSCASFWRSVLSGRTWQGDVRNHTRHGVEFFVRLTVTPLCDASHRTTHLVALHEATTDLDETGAGIQALDSALDSWRSHAASVTPV
jgi:PAS domain S-box-containing protein